MTPFGEHMRKLRTERGVTLKVMAEAIGVSSAYLSALEHGKRGRPGWHLIQRILSYFNIIWDEADDVLRLARISHPKITIDTAGLSPDATELANRLALAINYLQDDTITELLSRINRDIAAHKLKPKI
jgi:transcriptional regulator with XRE-family HTH domain